MAKPTPESATPDESADWDAIARYFAGESSGAEGEAVRRWLDAHPEQAAALSALNEATGKLIEATPPGLDVEAALARVTARRDAPDVVPIDTGRTSRPTVRASPPRRWLREAIPIAAAAVLVLAVSVYWHSAREAGYTVPTVAQVIATDAGQRDSVRLPDGTRVVLSPESRLTVTAGYGRDVREVQLQGEAYFDVLHDEARPFVVRAGAAAIRDLGTTFTVRAIADQPVRVAVTSGLVSLAPASASGDSVVLRPGDAGTVADGKMVVERGGVAETDTAWTRGRLVFRETPMAEVRAQLRRWYGIDLQVDSTFASRHLSMTFDGESVDRVLEVMALSLGATVERQGSVAVLRPARGVK
jgi:transmembrane sensor